MNLVIRLSINVDEPTRCVCPVIVLTAFEVSVSHILTSPLLVPTAKCVPLCIHPMPVMWS